MLNAYLMLNFPHARVNTIPDLGLHLVADGNCLERGTDLKKY